MLNIFLGDMKEAVFDPATYFKNRVRDEWITDSLSVDMIQDIDHSKVLGPHIIESPVFGGISPLQLSGGVKTLILINNVPDRVFNASACGDNCAKWLLKIGEAKDVTINLRHIMDFGTGEFSIRIINTDTILNNQTDFAYVASDYVR